MLYYPNVLLMDLDQQNLWEKLFLKKDTLSKDADHWLASFHEISISHRCSSMCKSNMWLISGTFCADGLLRFMTFTELPWKSIYDFIGKHFEKKNLNGEFQVVGLNLAERKNNKSFKKSTLNL